MSSSSSFIKKCVTGASFMALASNGMILAFLGTSLPALQSSLSINIEMAGLLMAILQTGFTIFTLISGVFTDLYRRERIVACGCFLLSSGSLFLCLVPSLMLTALCVTLMGAGIGCILSGTNALLAGLYPENKRRILNTHHVFFSLGSFVGPLLMGYLLTRNSIWHWGYIGAGILLLLLGMVFLVTTATENHLRVQTKFVGQMKTVARDKAFLLILVVNSLAVGTQLAVMLLGVTYLQQSKHIPVATAGTALSIFAISMMAGRVVCSRLSTAIRNSTIILILLALQFTTMLLIWLGNGPLALTALALSGFGFSGIYPTSLALTGILFPRVEGSALGILSTMAGVGSIVICGAIGYVAGIADMQWGFFIVVLACLLSLMLFSVFYRRLGKREAGLQAV